MTAAPPGWVRWILRRLVPPDRLEDIEGDLIELYHARAETSGRRSAHVRYWIDLLSVLRRASRLGPWPSHSPAGSGSSTRFSDASREGRMIAMLRATVSEFRFASRMLMQRPAYAALSAGTLALGIGATVAIFTVLNAVLLRPLPYADSDRIVEVRHYAPGLNMPEVRSSPGLIARYRQHARTLTDVGGYEIRQLNLAGAGDAERVRTVAATPNLFRVLAVRPALGRLFDDSDTARNTQQVVILTDGVWRSRFGADPAVIGRTLRLDGQLSEVVGVMPPTFAFPDTDTRLFVPLRIEPDAGFGSFGMTSLARLAPNATIDAARTEIMQLQQRLPEWFPGITPEILDRFQWSANVQPFRDRVIANIATTLWFLFAAVTLVLVVAASNVANLLLVRAEGRQREVAVKAALGASRGRIAAAFVAESVLLALAAGVLGLLIADSAVGLLVAYGPPRLPRRQEIGVDASVLAFTALVVVVSGVLLSILPALNAARRSLVTTLRDGGRGSTAGRARHRARQLLIVTQVAIALVLMVSAGLLLKSVTRLSAVDPGFTVNGLLTAGLSLGRGTNRSEAIARYERILDEMSAVPGVSSVGAAGTLPVSAGGLTGSNFAIRSRTPAATDGPLFSMHTGVTAGYFETLGVPLVSGRFPVAADSHDSRSVAWVNQAFARRFLPTRAVGEAIRFEGEWLDIVGVVGDLRISGVREQAPPMVYLPLSDPAARIDAMFAVVRTDAQTAVLAPALRAAVDRVDATVPLTLRTAEDIVATSLAETTFTVTLIAIAAGLGLLLGLVGLYGAISYIVQQRTAEIGVRLALGANPGVVLALVLRQGAAVALAGIVIGLVVAWSSARLMSTLLFEVSAYDPPTYGSTVVLLLAVSTLATYLPARRAARIDPVQALRHDC